MTDAAIESGAVVAPSGPFEQGEVVTVTDSTGQFNSATFVATVVEYLDEPCVVVDDESGRHIVKASDVTTLKSLPARVKDAVSNAIGKRATRATPSETP